MPSSAQKDLEKSHRIRDVAHSKFKRKASVLQDQIDNDGTSEILRRCFEDMSKSYDQLEEKHEEYMEKLCLNKGLDSELDREETFMDHIDSMKISVTTAYDATRPQSINSQNSVTVKPRIKVKPIDPPTFDGDIRQYLTFIADYDRIMKETYGDNPYALKQCLTGDARNTIRGVEDDYTQMMKRLNDRYGDPTKLTDNIINEIKAIETVPDGDNRKLIAAIDTIEQCWLDMKRFKLEKEMSTVSVISIIEKVLPRDQKKEWVKIYHKIEDKSRTFPELLKYLLDEKQTLCYMDDDVRSNNKTVKAAVNSTDTVMAAVNSTDVEKEPTFKNALKELKDKQSNLENMLSQFMINKKPTMSYQERKFDAPCWIHNTPGHSIEQCKVFEYLNNGQKVNIMKKHGVCFKCIKRGHMSNECRQPPTCYAKDSQGNICNEQHHIKLHGVFDSSLEKRASVHSTGNIDGNVMLPVQRVRCNNQMLTTMYDSGSTVSLITHKRAQRLGLENVPVTITIKGVGNIPQTAHTKQYTVPLVDRFGNTLFIKAFGMDEITDTINDINERNLSEIFEIHQDLYRPHGEVELLVGIDSCLLFPTVVKTVDNLQLLENMFGYCIRGSFSKHFLNDKSYSANVNHITVVPNSVDFTVNCSKTFKEELDYVLNDNLDEVYQTKCHNCKNCKDCLNMENMTLKEDRELQIIKKGLKYNKEKCVWLVNYPWIKDPSMLPNNFIVAKIKLVSTEKRLKKLGATYTNAYCGEITDMIERKVARKISSEEIMKYRGPIHYISHHEILKPTSSSTPFRIVFNSSAPFNGHVLNDYWAKGPDILNNIFGLILRFREGLIGFIGDLSKMFNSVELSVFDQHVHRFLWRSMNTDIVPETYVLTAVPFGDRPSGCIVMLAMKETAHMMKDNFPLAYKIIDEDSYVDDILHSLDSIDEVKHVTKEIEHILKQGGFKVKSWITSGMTKEVDDIEILDTESERVLGLKWNPKSDNFQFETKLNFSPKKRGIRTAPNLTRGNINNELPQILTKRLVLSQIAAIYDPIGLVAPVVLKGKLLMRKCVSYTNDQNRKLDWDDPLPGEIRNEWCEFFKEMFLLENIKIPRCIKVSHDDTDPKLVVFCDASLNAYGTCAYVRWRSSDSKFHCKLLASKIRLAPIKTQTIPKLELCSAVLSSRLRKAILKESRIKFSSIIHFTDSEIVFFQLIKDNIRLGTYVSNRVQEIQDSTQSDDWYWIPSQHNIADILTRSNDFKTEMQATWINGPSFLYLPEKEWPTKNINQMQRGKADSQEIFDAVSMATACKTIGLDIIDTARFSSYKKLICVTAIVINIFKRKSFKGSCIISSSDIQEAEIAWVKQVQIDIMHDWNIRFKRLGPFLKNEIVFVGSRIANWMKENWNQEAFMLLPSQHHFTMLVLKTYHNRDHAGIEATLCKVQTKFWIPHARKLLKRVKRECVICRKNDRKITGQTMGPLNEKRLKPSPPFYNSALDLFGPFMIKDTVKGRTRKKVYGIIINCLVTRAVYIDLVEGYDTDSLLTTLRRFISIRGFPKTMYSDHGSQLVLADKNLKDLIKDWDCNKLTTFGNNEGMEWSFTKSADAPWENGCSEALIRLIKKHLVRIIGDNILTFGELQTVLFEISNLMNERPIGTKPGSNIDLGTYLCPNDLLLGRSGLQAPRGIFAISSNLKCRQEFIDQITDNFWKKWMRDFFHTLIIRQKWHTTVRNLEVGDIVLVQDSNMIRGKWKLAQISKVLPSSDNIVRDVIVRYKQQRDGKSYTGIMDTEIKRSAHRLVLLLPVEEQ